MDVLAQGRHVKMRSLLEVLERSRCNHCEQRARRDQTQIVQLYPKTQLIKPIGQTRTSKARSHRRHSRVPTRQTTSQTRVSRPSAGRECLLSVLYCPLHLGFLVNPCTPKHLLPISQLSGSPFVLQFSSSKLGRRILEEKNENRRVHKTRKKNTYIISNRGEKKDFVLSLHTHCLPFGPLSLCHQFNLPSSKSLKSS